MKKVQYEVSSMYRNDLTRGRIKIREMREETGGRREGRGLLTCLLACVMVLCKVSLQRVDVLEVYGLWKVETGEVDV